MTIFNCLFEPKKSAIKDGAVPLAISIEASNKKVAESIVTGKLWEHYPANGDNYFKPKVWEDAPGQPRSKVGAFDEEFAKTHEFDGDKWVTKSRDAGAQESTGTYFPAADEVIDLMKIPPRERFAAVLLFGNTALDGATYLQVCDYLDNLDNGDASDDEEQDHFNRLALNAMEEHIPVKSMHVDGLNNLVQGMYARFENHTPGILSMQQFVKKWTDNPGKRDEMPPPAKPQVDNAGTTVAPQRGYKHTYATLDQEIALALLPVEAGVNVSVSALRDAEKIIESDREDFKRWSVALRTTEQILKYDRLSVFGVIQNVPAKDTYHFPDTLRRHIVSWLKENGRFEDGQAKPEVQIKNHGDGRFSVEGLVPENTSNEGEKVEVQKTHVSQAQADKARKTLNNMGYGVYAPKPEESRAPSVFDVEKTINERLGSEQENLALWKRVFRTDERFTKAFTQNGGGTSINGTYMTMLATREFGPKGIGWGVDILEERFDDGAPIIRKVKGPDGNQAWDLIPDGKGGYLTEKNHIIKVRLWYIRNGERGEEVAYGCTPYIYDSKYGPICDGEATKKSLTDATKKALSSLGFSADIFMGLYDNPEYRQQNKAEFAIKNASENAEDAARLRQEMDDKLTRVASTLETGVSTNEINKVYSSVAREIEVHRKDAEGKGDTQYASYLSARLRRLTTIKTDRINEINKAEEKTK